MNNPYHFTKTLLPILMAVILAACTTDDIDTSRLKQPLTMRLVGGLTQFDDSTATRAAGWSWQNGATVYIQFKNGNNTISARAVYTQATDDWTMSSLSGNISTSGQCEVYFFDGASSVNQSTVTLGSSIGVYADRNGSYENSNGIVTVSTTLAPLTSRVRFQRPSGSSVTSLSVNGITYYTAYNITTNTFTSSNDIVASNVNASSGYTSYIYGWFANATNRLLTLTNSTDGSDITFTRTFGTNVLQTGKSGTLTIPTKADSKNWTMTDATPIEIEAVDLGLSVKWANMNVGANRPEDYGLYFAWGETVGYTSDTNDGRSFNWASYKWMTEGQSSWQWVNKYQVADGQADGCWYTDGTFTGDGLSTLLPEDDAATQNWGAKWRMPTLAEIQELLDNTTYTWTTRNGINGGLFTSTKNGNSIFIPAAGYRVNASLYYQGSDGDVWSASVYPTHSNDARRLNFSSGYRIWSNSSRNPGQSVRPVQGPAAVSLTVSPEALSFDATGSSKSVTVTCNSNWTASSNQSWCTVSPASGTNNGTITVTVGENTNTTSRNATITVTAGTVTKEVAVTQEGKQQTDNAPAGAEAVDLGLPSGTKWANMNVGATKPEGYGDLFAWGETKTKANYDWDTYTYCKEVDFSNVMTKYSPSVDSKTVLDASDDAAVANWGGKWRMPTYDEMKELIDNTTKEWATINGVSGRRFTGTNGNSIFLPATGINFLGQLYYRGSNGYYWSSTLYGPSTYYSTDSDAASYLAIDKTGAVMSYSDRYAGLAVRPVQAP